MKRTVLGVFIAILSLNSFAQLPNPGFELWRGDSSSCGGGAGGRSIPLGYEDYYLPFQCIGTVDQSTSSHTGTYALHLHCQPQAGGTPYVPQLGSGTFNAKGTTYATYHKTAKFKLTSKPLSLNGYAAFYPAWAGDSFSISLLIYSGSALVGTDNVFITAKTYSGGLSMPVYVPFGKNVTYTSGLTPDSASVLFQFQNRGSINPHVSPQTEGYIDDIDISTFVTASVEKESPKYTVYPNPVKEQLEISTGTEKMKALTLFSTSGQILLNAEISNSFSSPYQLNTQGLKPGIYLLRIESSTNGYSYERIVVSE
jgi:hypothetical protein